MTAVTVHNAFGTQENKICPVTASNFSAAFSHEVMGLDAMILVFWMLTFKSDFSLLFHPHQETLYILFTICH